MINHEIRTQLPLKAVVIKSKSPFRYTRTINFYLCTCRGQLESSVAEEKRFNPRLTKDIDTFVDIMEHLNLPKPKMIGKFII